MEKLSDYLSMQRHFKNLQNSFKSADNEEIDLNKLIAEQKQEMKLIQTIREFENTIEEVKQMKTNFEQEKKQYFKQLEEYTTKEVEKAIKRGLENAFTK